MQKRETQGVGEEHCKLGIRLLQQGDEGLGSTRLRADKHLNTRLKQLINYSSTETLNNLLKQVDIEMVPAVPKTGVSIAPSSLK